MSSLGICGHFFNTLAVKDRISLAHHSSSTTIVNPDAVDLDQYLPSSRLSYYDIQHGHIGVASARQTHTISPTIHTSG